MEIDNIAYEYVQVAGEMEALGDQDSNLQIGLARHVRSWLQIMHAVRKSAGQMGAHRTRGRMRLHL